MATKKSLFISVIYFIMYCYAFGSSLINIDNLEGVYTDPEFSLPCSDNSNSVKFLGKSNPWHEIAATKKLELFEAQDWINHEDIIPHLPVHLSHRVNLTDATVSILGKHKLKETLLQKFAEAVERENPHVLQEKEQILKLGNIFCGFSQFHMSCISDDVLQSLWNYNFFRSVRGCKTEKLGVLLKKLQKTGIIGPSKTWSAETIKRLGILVSGLPGEDFKKIRLQSMTSISPEIIRLTPPDTLKKMFTDQLRSLSRQSLLQWRRTTKDSRPLYARSTKLSPEIRLLILCSIMSKVVIQTYKILNYFLQVIKNFLLGLKYLTETRHKLFISDLKVI